MVQHLPECQLILDKLKNELPANLQYHSIDHTLDVYHSAAALAKEEGINASDLKLLLVAAIYHDAGYLIRNRGHELYSCVIARKYLPKFQYRKEDINLICEMIMATRIPHQPKTHLQEIICDADLNYLGRTDFFSIGAKLYQEMIAFGYVENWDEWNRIQLDFLQQHHYFTATAMKHNQSQKEKNLAIVQSEIKS